ncbi:phosphoribosyl-ATP pyrophosphohydrolase [Clostridium sp. MF28]|uniref:nucleoside triphosphate pyrophosphohydrolase n=1 Tax=Clostridium TaxID=1485 RepID=UPI000CF8BBD5|nr:MULTISPECIES: nucleoside triphosphate pyrophosphohydrolase [Clostridium]AVK51361.1 phosphoribosyl-ATP pyrophosphohydrolase [Clostridium sp. MF28]PSM59418.1 phosphoribosyl-ATP pyrophosphohydrolase [Clostridium diolis]
MQIDHGNLKENNKINENSEKTYNKLIRDKIPEIIKADRRECDTLTADGDEKYKLLEAKLQEEVNEFLEDKNLEELADVMEVLFGLADRLGYSEEELLKARDKKREERGGFKEGIVLKSVNKPF